MARTTSLLSSQRLSSGNERGTIPLLMMSRCQGWSLRGCPAAADGVPFLSWRCHPEVTADHRVLFFYGDGSSLDSGLRGRGGFQGLTTGRHGVSSIYWRCHTAMTGAGPHGPSSDRRRGTIISMAMCCLSGAVQWRRTENYSFVGLCRRCHPCLTDIGCLDGLEMHTLPAASLRMCLQVSGLYST